MKYSLVSGYLALLYNGSDPTLKADPNVYSLMAVTQIASTCVIVSQEVLASDLYS